MVRSYESARLKVHLGALLDSGPSQRHPEALPTRRQESSLIGSDFMKRPSITSPLDPCADLSVHSAPYCLACLHLHVISRDYSI